MSASFVCVNQRESQVRILLRSPVASKTVDASFATMTAPMIGFLTVHYLHHDTRLSISSVCGGDETTMTETERDQPRATSSSCPYSSDDVLLLPEVGVVPDRHCRLESIFPWVERQGADSSKGRQINLHDTRGIQIIRSVCGGDETAMLESQRQRDQPAATQSSGPYCLASDDVLLLPEVGVVPDRHSRRESILPWVEAQGADSSKGREINLHHVTRGRSVCGGDETTMIERQRDQPAAALSFPIVSHPMTSCSYPK